MTDMDDKAIRRRSDGSIDTTHYMRQGREQRSSMHRAFVAFLARRMTLRLPVSRRAAPDTKPLLKGAEVS